LDWKCVFDDLHFTSSLNASPFIQVQKARQTKYTVIEPPQK
jgi:hypothetical protein